ncbi:MAG TPA: hypothetical protein VIJ11_07045 [Galbitalea sp.]
MPTYAVLLIGLGGLLFAAGGLVAMVRPAPIATFVESRGIRIRIGAVVQPTADNIRMIGIEWLLAGGLIAICALIFVASR